MWPVQKQDGQDEHTFSSYVRIRDVVLKTCLGRWTIGRSGERGPRISVLPARHDDDDDIYIYIYIYIYICVCVWVCVCERERGRERNRERENDRRLIGNISSHLKFHGIWLHTQREDGAYSSSLWSSHLKMYQP